MPVWINGLRNALADMNDCVVTFIIRVRHQENAKDWNALKAHLKQAAQSIAAQTDSRWQAFVVANDGADLPELRSNSPSFGST